MTILNSGYIFEAKNLSYDYPGNIEALRQINFAIAPGEMVALVGANGSGKSTLLKLLDGLIFPAEGELLAFGQAALRKDLKRQRFCLRVSAAGSGWYFKTRTCSFFLPQSGTK